MTRLWRRALFTGALLLLAQLAPQLAHAQYSWIDAKGTRVFSDRPPPPGTPASRILKGPRVLAPALAAPDPGTGPVHPDAATAKPKAPPSLAEQDAAFRQRQLKRDEDARKAQTTAEQKAALEERCASARQEERLVTSGVRVSGVDARGERYFLTDEDKARRAAVARRALLDCR
jgi:hypothetical protein